MAETQSDFEMKEEDSFANDLDAMLDEAMDDRSETGELLKDELAIDQLLMSEALETTPELSEEHLMTEQSVEPLKPEEEIELTESGEVDEFSEGFEPENAETDEFEGTDELGTESESDQAFSGELEDTAEVEAVDEVAEATESDNSHADDLEERSEADTSNQEQARQSTETSDEKLDAIIDDAMSENDEVENDDAVDQLINAVNEPDTNDVFAEIDEFAEPDDVDEFAENTPPVSETEEEDDFLMADFDISADDAIAENDASDLESEPDADESEELLDEVTDANEIDSIDSSEVDDIEEDDDASDAELDQQNNISTQELDSVRAEIQQLTSLVKELKSENEALNEKLIETSAAIENAKVPDLSDDLETVQQQQKKLKRTLQGVQDHTPVILYVALGVAIIALLIGSGLGMVGYSAQTDVDELTEIVATLEEESEMLVAVNADTKLKDLFGNVKSLKQMNDQVGQKIDSVNQQLLNNPLKPIVNDLVEQNDQALAAIDQLVAKVETLEKFGIKKSKSRIAKPVKKVNWVVNLVSFKQKWYAERKLNEYKKQGINASIVPVKIDGESWFRILVKGFKSQYEAAAYAVKVKKTLNLTSVWVTKT